MILVDGEKYACQQCIRGHRSSSCKHIQRPLVLVRSRGRPLNDSQQRIAIYAETIDDEVQRNNMLSNEKGSVKHLIPAKRIVKSDEQSQGPVSCCQSSKANQMHPNVNSVLDLSSNPPNTLIPPMSPVPAVRQESPASSSSSSSSSSSCCSAKTDTSPVPVPLKTQVCNCCPDNEPAKSCKKGEVFVLKAVKRQVFNVEKTSLKLLDPVADVPSSKVGLDMIHKISKSKKHCCKDKKVRDAMKRLVHSHPIQQLSKSCCGNKSSTTASGIGCNDGTVVNNNTTNNRSMSNTTTDPNMKPMIFQFQVPTKASLRNQAQIKNASQFTDHRSPRLTPPPSTSTQDFPDSQTSQPRLASPTLPVHQIESNGFLYDLYIAKSCVVPGSCACDPDKCQCPDCSEHGMFKNSNLSLREQFAKFPFSRGGSGNEYSDSPLIRAEPANITARPVPGSDSASVSAFDPTPNSGFDPDHGVNNLQELMNEKTPIRPYGQVSVKQKIPLYDAAFFNALENGEKIDENVNLEDYTANNQNMDGMSFQGFSTTVFETTGEDCYCDDDACFCYGCTRHGIVNGVRIADGRFVSDILNEIPEEIQLSTSEYPLFETSSSATSTPNNEDFIPGRNENINDIGSSSIGRQMDALTDKEQWIQNFHAPVQNMAMNDNIHLLGSSEDPLLKSGPLDTANGHASQETFHI